MRPTLSHAIALFCACWLFPAAVFAQVDGAPPLSTDVRLNIERDASGITISGNASSQAHPTILREVVRQSPGDVMQSELDINLSSDALAPAGWSLITEMVLRGVLATQTSSAVVTPSSVAIQGITTDLPAWNSALQGIRRASLNGMSIQAEVLEADDGRDHPRLCIARFSELTRSMQIRFDASSAEIGGDTYRALDALVEWSTQCPALEIIVVGHTDQSGDTDANLAISAARAHSVESYLLARGLPPSRVQSRAAGATEPFTSATDLRSRRMNRRVDIKLQGQ